jgi:hypothetical protein
MGSRVGGVTFMIGALVLRRLCGDGLTILPLRSRLPDINVPWLVTGWMFKPTPAKAARPNSLAAWYGERRRVSYDIVWEFAGT